MKNIIKNHTLIICLFFIIIISISPITFCFTDEEQEQIDITVSKMTENSYNSGCKYNLDSGSTNKIFLSVNQTFNNKSCKYMALMYWNNQYNITLTDNVITAKCVWYNNHELVSFYYDSDLNCIGYNIDDLYEGNSVTFDNINSYFSSTFTVRDSSGNVVEPFFPTPPQVEIMALTQVEEIPQMMNKVLQLIIPVGLVVLSIGLLIYLIRLAILRVI